MGVPKKEIHNMDRWARVEVIKARSEHVSGFDKYSRHSNTKREEYNSDIATIFKFHCESLEPPDEDVIKNRKDWAQDIEDAFAAEPEASEQREDEKTLRGKDEQAMADELVASVGSGSRQTRIPETPETPFSPGTPGLSGASAKPSPSPPNNLPNPAAPAPRKRRKRVKRTRRVLKITRMVKDESGVLQQTVESIYEPDEIEKYLKSRSEAHEIETHGLSDRQRERLKQRNEERLKMELAKLRRKVHQTQEDDLMKRGQGSSNIRCSKCNMLGHMRTNKKCPLYLEGGPDDEGVVQATGSGTIRINTERAEELEKGSRLKGKSRLTDGAALIDHEEDGVLPTTKKDPRMQLRLLLLSIVQNLKLQKDWVGPFLHPVSLKQCPDYKRRVSEPMCIEDIVKRIENSAIGDSEAGSRRRHKKSDTKSLAGYRNASEFDDDLQLLYRNAYLYNGPAHEVTVKAQKLVNLGQRALAGATAKISALVAEIEEIDKEQSLLDTLMAIVQVMVDDRIHSEAFQKDPAKYIPDYTFRIRKPMYLDRITNSIRDCKYASVAQFVADCHLIVQNSRVFNGVDNIYTRNAEDLLKIGQEKIEKLYPQL
eukprot:628490_1